MTNTTTDLSVVSRLVVIVPNFTCWTGCRAMHEGDFEVGVDGKLPPKEVARSLGRKAVIDTDELNAFARIKRSAESTLEGAGVRFLNGWAVPEEKAEELFHELDGLVKAYEEEKVAFLAKYESLVEAWAAKNPEFASEIRAGKLDVAAVASRIHGTYASFRLLPSCEAKAEELAKSVEGLSGDLIASIARAARKLFTETFLNRQRANQKTVNAIRHIRERLQGLSFLSSRIAPLVAMIDGVLMKLPQEGYFTGEPFWRLAALINALGDEKLLERIMDGTISDGGMLPSVNPDEPDLVKEVVASEIKALGTGDEGKPSELLLPAIEKPSEEVLLASQELPPAVDVGDGFYF